VNANTVMWLKNKMTRIKWRSCNFAAPIAQQSDLV
jgi:hypothetical protein